MQSRIEDGLTPPERRKEMVKGRVKSLIQKIMII
jgi:hypothetical protein